MRQRDHDWTLAETLADAVLEWGRTEESRDRQLPDQDQDLRLEQPQLGIEPVRAIRDCGGRWRPVTGVLPVAPGKAAHQRGDVSEAAKLLGILKAGTQHPAVELLPGTPRERAPADLFRRSWRLADHEE